MSPLVSEPSDETLVPIMLFVPGCLVVLFCIEVNEGVKFADVVCVVNVGAVEKVSEVELESGVLVSVLDDGLLGLCVELVMGALWV